MREKILAALRNAGHGLTVLKLWDAVGEPVYMPTLVKMEEDKLIIIHRSSGGAGITKGMACLVCLRPENY